jgi:acyl carrier protein
MYRCDIGDNIPLIGKPMPNIQTYVLDRYQQLLPIGYPGELHIGGLGLAREYVNDPDQTKEAFPYLTIDGKRSRYYKTGDFVKLHLSGDLEYLHRKDEQVKVRGYRIELSEIEKTILTHSMIQSCRVVLTQSNEKDEVKSIVAFIVRKTSHDSDAVLREAVIKYVSTQLPHYMRPQQYYFLKALPLSLHDKVNNAQLHQLVKTLPAHKDQPPIVFSNKERLLVSLFQSLFKTPIKSVNTDFFTLGGDSMTAMTLTASLKSHGFRISLNDVFNFSTIQALAKRLAKIDTSATIEKRHTDRAFTALAYSTMVLFTIFRISKSMEPSVLYHIKATSIIHRSKRCDRSVIG